MMKVIDKVDWTELYDLRSSYLAQPSDENNDKKHAVERVIYYKFKGKGAVIN